MRKKLAFTGHRPESLPFGENENDQRYIHLKAMLLTEITDRVKAGYDTFYTGCARGMDIVFGTQVLVKKTACPHIRLIGVVPHEGRRTIGPRPGGNAILTCWNRQTTWSRFPLAISVVAIMPATGTWSTLRMPSWPYAGRIPPAARNIR